MVLTSLAPFPKAMLKGTMKAVYERSTRIVKTDHAPTNPERGLRTGRPSMERRELQQESSCMVIKHNSLKQFDVGGAITQVYSSTIKQVVSALTACDQLCECTC
jgi:hypothetical protein